MTLEATRPAHEAARPVTGLRSERRLAHRIDAGSSSVLRDAVAVEEPLELRIAGIPLTVMMRTPGHDIELVQGFLVSEGIVARRDDICAIRCHDDDPAARAHAVVDVVLTEEARGRAGASCVPVPEPGALVSAGLLTGLPDVLGEQRFDVAGGLPAAALFSRDGELLVLREDVVHDRAVDKVVGWALGQEWVSIAEAILLVVGRASSGLVQKAVMAGIPLLAAAGAPSTLALDRAWEGGVTLVGGLQDGSMNVYTHPSRVAVRG